LHGLSSEPSATVERERPESSTARELSDVASGLDTSARSLIEIAPPHALKAAAMGTAIAAALRFRIFP
jgi:hypothetical protein